MDAGTLKGLAVVSLMEGTKLGKVEHPLFDLGAHRMSAVEVHGDSGTFVIPFEQIERIGEDAMVVKSSDMTQTPSTGSALGTLVSLPQAGKLKVVNDTGTFLGTIDTIDIDHASGRITQLTIHKGGMLGMGGTTTQIDATAIIGVGPDILTVTSEGTIGDPAASSTT